MRLQATSKHCDALLCVVALALSASTAHAMPTYGELPIGSVTVPPSPAGRPNAISLDEHTGLRVLSASKTRNLAVEFDDGPTDKVSDCYAAQAPMPPGEAQRPIGWDRPLSSSVMGVWFQEMVGAVHGERVVKRGEEIALESTDVWLDRTKAATRLISKATLPLRQVSGAPGLAIFAGRDERKDGTRLVQFVLVPTQQSGFTALPRGAMRRTDGVVSTLSACAHQRVSLVAKAGGESAVVEMMTLLQGGRERPVRVHLSVSQTTRDSEPVLSVTTAWNGPEVTLPSGLRTVPAPAAKPVPTGKPMPKSVPDIDIDRF